VLAREFDAMARALKEREAQLKQKQEELLRAERLAAVGRVSAQVAHEVRNPLSSIGLNVEMLDEQLARATFATPEEAKEARELLASVTREIDRVTEVTEDYLRLARLPAPVLRDENVVAILEDVLAFSKGELDRASVKVLTTFPPTPLGVRADEAQLRQVFLNLVRNAREAMENGGTLTVTAWEKDGLAELRVQDTGSGMTPEVKERIFEPFFTTKQGGTGLGLSISRQIVEAHGGAVEVESTPGKGTTFILKIPT
jgi:signal transduction histidine kinase